MLNLITVTTVDNGDDDYNNPKGSDYTDYYRKESKDYCNEKKNIIHFCLGIRVT